MKARRGPIAAWLRVLTLCGVSALALGPAAAQGLVPAELFSAPIDQAADVAVEADTLSFDARSNVITANGDVELKFSGYTLRGQALTFNRAANDVRFTGAVTVIDPAGNRLDTQNLEVTGGAKQAFIDSLTITTSDGAQIRADSVEYDEAVQTLLVNARYAPCGDCIDEEGRRIGWSVSASRIIYNAEDKSVTLEQPTLALLGFPVAWLPYLYLPDTSDSALQDFELPTVDYGDKTGLKVAVPYKAYSSRWTDIILTPTLVTRQGFLLGAEWVQRFDAGSFRVKASGIYQMDPSAFSRRVPGAREEWRGAIQTSGRFRPVRDWVAGWSYTAFSDAAYLKDYRLDAGDSSINQVYATHLSRDTYFDARLQQFVRLGNVTPAQQEQQGTAIPNVRFNQRHDLAEGWGTVDISARLLGVQRERNMVRRANGVPYVFGYAGNKTHASVEAGWQNRFIGAGGFVATPYLGLRADGATYDGASTLDLAGTRADAPEETSLWSLTPIAAMDVRFPLAASDGSTVHLIEPIAQLVYRGTSETLPGITNDDAQSFVFDDTNLFSFNRFSGSDRQDTGLRANVGGRYQANFADGGYLELVGGQSFHLAGVNSFANPDGANTGVGYGLEDSASYAVLGAYARFSEGVRLGGKVLVDTPDLVVKQAALGAGYSGNGYSAGLDYLYVAANAERGVLDDQHEIGATVGVPVTDYWTVRANAYYDLAQQSVLQYGGGLYYDDGYLEFGAAATRTGPTHIDANDTRFTATFRLKAPAGFDVGLDY